MSAIVEVEAIERSFGTTRALCGIDLEVSEGRVVALLGPNGAGKTTLVRILATLLRPDRGRARVAGFDVVTQPTAVRRVIGLAGQHAAIDETLTGRENLEMIGRLSRLGKTVAAQRAQEVLERTSLVDAADRALKTYSGGMRRRVDLGAGLVAHPRVLLLDEPTTGLDPVNRVELWGYLRELVREGASVLLTTQYLEEADQLASQVVVIDHGTVIASGTPGELKDRLGGDVLDVTVTDDEQIPRAVEVLTRIGEGRINVDQSARRLTVPVRSGAHGLVEAVRAIDDAGLSMSDLVLRRPSLDDVFLALTGHATSDGDGRADGEPDGQGTGDGHRARGGDRRSRHRPEEVAP
jgi:ABC-2 type transport system ATP-binding protein